MTSLKPDGRIEFRFYRPQAREVAVAGSFNDWCTESLKMRPAEDGWWIAIAAIESGVHQFRYVADGRWYTDFAANGIEMSKHGPNSLLVVPETEQYTLRIAA